MAFSAGGDVEVLVRAPLRFTNAFMSDCAIHRLASYTSRRIATVCIIGKMPVWRKVVLLDRLEVGEEPPHRTAIRRERRRHARGVQGVDLRRSRASPTRLRGTDRLHLDVGRQVELDLLRAAGLLLASGEVSDTVHRDP
jgi:hypothetical protein